MFENYEIKFEDEEKIILSKFDEEYKMWIECVIPKDKNNYEELNNVLKSLFISNVKG